MSAGECPDFDDWRWLLGDVPSPADHEWYERHLESCPTCQSRLDTAADCGDMRRLGRQIGDPTVVPADSTLVNVIDRCKSSVAGVGDPDLVRPGSQTPATENPTDLYFLRPSKHAGILGTLGPYEVHEVIGQGGMGVVLKAYEPALHRLVAIKVLAAAVAGSATARRRFTREAQAAAAVCHEHIVPVHGVHETDGLPYLVMQYVAGESLQGRLDRAGPLEVTEAVRIGLQTAAGLAAAHAQGLIHRDIKPANLLLENGLARVRITDFGLARMADDAPVTQPGVVAGTPEYMAPEQARGEPVDQRADLFSLGSMLYAMCTGRPPFRGPSAVAILRQVSDEPPPPVRSLNPGISDWLVAVIARLMAKDPADRFQTAAEVAVLLEGYLAHLGQPATVAPPVLPASPAATTGHPKGRIGLAVALAAGAVVFAVASGLAVATGDGWWNWGAGDPGAPFEVWSAVTSRDGRILAAGGGRWDAPGEIGVWDLPARTPRRRFAEEGGVASVALSPDGKWLASGAWDGHVRVRDWAAGSEVADFEIGTVARVAFSPDGDLLATASEGQAVQLWDVAGGRLVADLDGDQFRFQCVTFSPDGRQLYVGGGDWRPAGVAQVNVWDVPSRRQVLKVTGHANTVLAVACSPDGTVLATASVDQTIRLWDAATGKPLRTLLGHTGAVHCVAFSADGKTVVSGGDDQTVGLWDAASGKQIASIPRPGVVRTACLTPDGKAVVVGGVHKTLAIVDAATHAEVAGLWTGAAAEGAAMDAVPAVRPARPARRWLVVALSGVLSIALTFAAVVAARRGRRADVRAPAEPPGEVSGSPGPRFGGRPLWPAAWVAATAAAVAALGLAGRLDGPGRSPPASGTELYQDFRGLKPRHPALKWAGIDGTESIEPDDRGLRIRLTPARTRKDPGGLALTTDIKGEFQVTAGYELLGADPPKTGQGVGFELYVTTGTAAREAVGFGHVLHADGKMVYWCSHNFNASGRRQFDVRHFPTAGTGGRLRLDRTGGQIVCRVADGPADDFRELTRYNFGADDVTMVRVGAYPGQSTEPTDVRLVDLRVRTTAFEPAVAAGSAERTARSRRWLVAGEVTVLVTLAAGLAAWRARRKRKGQPSGAATPAAPPPANGAVSFRCPKCKTAVKAPAAAAGKKARCPRCGRAVPVPAAAGRV